jgi:DNA-binding SARP family transcriptional activator/WD40 repeat protein
MYVGRTGLAAPVPLKFHILGPLEALDEGQPVALGGSKQRALLALLLLHANETLSTDRLIDELWGERPPATAPKAVQVHVSRLRKALAAGNGATGDGLVVTREHGYELQLEPERLDLHQFERLVADARGNLAAGRPDRAVSALDGALSLWRGQPLSELADEPFAQREIARLDDLRVAAYEQLIEVKLELGRHDEVVEELGSLIREHPYRERLRAQLMLALYRSDRQADALQVYQDARRTLVGELGIEPGERLRDLERAILAQDPALALPAVAAVELPPELHVATPLAGRETDLDWLRGHWRAAHSGAGRLVLVAGPGGIGKTRLAAELAGEVHRDRGAVHYASGADSPDAAHALLAGVRGARLPTLLVVDDVDRGGGELRGALVELVDGLAQLPVLVLATAEDPGFAPALRAEATLTLAPLDADGVRAVARLYAGARDDVAVPVERLAAASGGVPQRVHRAADEWARAEAARRLGAAAGRAASDRMDLRVSEDELAGSVVELQAVGERAELGNGERPIVACPFKGLASFDLEDAELFFGRERLVAEMVARLTGAPLMGIVGPSGSGKSSALRAGLLAALSAGVLPGSEGWALALLRPGEHPLQALERATAESAPQGRLVVAVDQFEEAFTACRDESEREAFIEALVGFARGSRRRALVLVAVRADFYGRCAAYPELSRLLGANHVLVGPMRRAELRRAIELPARRAGLTVEPDLLDALVADVDGEPGALPLLSTSLLELWQRRDGRRLRMSAYEHTGGVHGAVARLAESAYERLDTERRRVARSILLRLAGEGEGEAVVRRRVPLAELEAGRDEGVAEVLAVLAADRLVTIGGGEVEVAHEALLREWPRLRSWLEEDADGRRLHRHLIHAAREWQGSGDPAELYRGARLASSLDWAASHDSELNDLERQFLDESRTASEREAERQRRTNRRLRALLAGVGVLLVAAVVAGVIAISERQGAREAATVADAERLGAEALNEERLDHALRLASAGVALDDSVATRSNLLSTLLRSPAAIGVLSGDGDPIRSRALSANGGTLALGDDDGTVTLFDTETREPIGDHQAPGVVWSLAFDPRTDSLAIAGSASPGLLSGYVEILDADTARVRSSISLGRHPAGAGLAFFETANYSPDGRSLIVTYSGGDLDRTTGTFMRRFDAREATPQGRAVRVAPRSTSTAPMSSSDGRLLFSSDKATYAVEAQTLRVDRRYPVGALTAGISADGGTLAVEDMDGSLRLLDLASGRLRTLAGAAAGVRRSRDIGEDARYGIGAFSPDGRTLATWDDSEKVILWDVREGLPTETFEGHTRDAGTQVFSPDGRTLYTAGDDSKVIIWDVAGDRRLGRPFQTEFVYETGELFPPPFAISPDGRTVAVARLDGRVDLIDAETLRRTGGFEAFADRSAVAIEYAPDGRALAVAGGGGGVGVWDAASGRRVGPLLRAPRGHVENNPHNVQGLAFGPRGLLAAAEVGGTVRTWDLGRRASSPARRCAWLRSCSASPSARMVPSWRSRSVRGSRRVATASKSATCAAASGSLGCPSTGRSVRSPSLLTGGCSPAVRSTAMPCSGRPTAGSGSERRWLYERRPLSRSRSPRTAERLRPHTPTARSYSGTSARGSRSARRLRFPGRRARCTRRHASPPTATACSPSTRTDARPAGRSIRMPGGGTLAWSRAASPPSNGPRSCRSRTTSRPVPPTDDLDRIAPGPRMSVRMPPVEASGSSIGTEPL